MPWIKMLACVTGVFDQELLAQIEYLIEETRILRNQITTRLRLTDPERKLLAEKAVMLGKLMADTVTIVKPEYLLHYLGERNHQGIGNVIPFPDERLSSTGQNVERAERLGGLLSVYHREAA